MSESDPHSSGRAKGRLCRKGRAESRAGRDSPPSGGAFCGLFLVVKTSFYCRPCLWVFCESTTHSSPVCRAAWLCSRAFPRAAAQGQHRAPGGPNPAREGSPAAAQRPVAPRTSQSQPAASTASAPRAAGSSLPPQASPPPGRAGAGGPGACPVPGEEQQGSSTAADLVRPPAGLPLPASSSAGLVSGHSLIYL